MRSKFVALVAVTAAITLGAAGSALGRAGDPQLIASPASAAPGEVFTVLGDFCFAGAGGFGVDAAGPATGPPVQVGVNFPTPATTSTTADPTTGKWSVELTVPAGTPPGNYEVTADCDNSGGGGAGVRAGGDVSANFAYSSVPFTVTGTPEPPLTTPPAPETSPAAPAPDDVASRAPGPAQPVGATPRTAG